MIITVKLNAHFRKGRFDIKDIDYPEGTRVSDVIRELRLNKDEIIIIFVNHTHAKREQELHGGDVAAFFPLVGGG